MEEIKKEHTLSNVFFTADLHFHHKNILKHCPKRGEVGGFDPEDVEAHDKWLIEKWNSTIGKKDIVYILGDFAFGPSECVKKLLGKLNGQKFLILGNHDKSSDHLNGYFKQITQMKSVTFKKSNYDFLDEDFMVFMCHYPMITWPNKHYGCVECHGHCHNRLTEYNEESPDLRIDIGIDNGFKLWSLKDIYEYFKEKTKGEKFLKYASDKKAEREMII